VTDSLLILCYMQISFQRVNILQVLDKIRKKVSFNAEH